MNKYVLKLLEQTQDYCQPFIVDTKGFNDQWWRSSDHTIDDATLEKHHYFQLLSGKIEIGRAFILNFDISQEITTQNSPESAWHLHLFEINAQYQRQGAGAHFAKALSEIFSYKPLVVFSRDYDSDQFWEKIGWIHVPRKLSKEGQVLPKMFISRNPNTLLQ